MTVVHLISASAPFKHQFESSSLAFTQMTSGIGGANYLAYDGPFQRYFYALEFSTVHTEKPSIRKFLYDIGHLLGIFSLFFGKQLRDHGLMNLEGFYSLPNTINLNPNLYFNQPFYGGKHEKPPDHTRDLGDIAKLQPLLDRLAQPKPVVPKIVFAAKCYSEALNIFPFDREIAYFRLIQALETAGADSAYTEEQRFGHDKQLTSHLEWLDEQADPRASKIAEFIKSRLYQVSRGVWLWVQQRIDGSFYINERYALTSTNLQKSLSSAYALRSQYVHLGVAFGDYIDPVNGRCADFETLPQYMIDLCPTKSLQKVLSMAPSFVGLERLVRYCLLKELKQTAI